MKVQIRKYVEKIFQDYTSNLDSESLKEEILANCYSRFDDLCATSMSEQEAYTSVIAGIGDVESILIEMGLEKKQKTQEQKTQEKPPVAEPDAVHTKYQTFYKASDGSYSAKEEKTTVTDDFKVYRKNKKANKELQSAFESLYWSLVVILYFFSGFFLRLWHINWLIFILAIPGYKICKIIFSPLYKNTNYGRSQSQERREMRRLVRSILSAVAWILFLLTIISNPFSIFYAWLIFPFKWFLSSLITSWI